MYFGLDFGFPVERGKLGITEDDEIALEPLCTLSRRSLSAELGGVERFDECDE